MAISPPSDIVLDVARAVEPQALEAATARLRAKQANASAMQGDAFGGTLAGMRATLGATTNAGSSTPESFVKFESMVLQTFVQSMLPSEAETVYGSGLAGDMWKSLLAQELADTMARRGGVGIADRVLGDFYLSGEDRIPVAGIDGDPQARDRQDARSLLSTAMVQEIQRSIMSASLVDASTPARGSR